MHRRIEIVHARRARVHQRGILAQQPRERGRIAVDDGLDGFFETRHRRSRDLGRPRPTISSDSQSRKSYHRATASNASSRSIGVARTSASDIRRSSQGILESRNFGCFERNTRMLCASPDSQPEYRSSACRRYSVTVARPGSGANAIAGNCARFQASRWVTVVVAYRGDGCRADRV